MNATIVDWLRALLQGDMDRHNALTTQLGNEGINQAQPLLTAALLHAVDRRFTSDSSRSEIVSFVAEAREQFDETGRDLDAQLCEELIRAALGEHDLLDHFSQKEIVKTQGVLLFKLIHDDAPSDADLEEFIAEAKTLAE